jgi:cytochrome b561
MAGRLTTAAPAGVEAPSAHYTRVAITLHWLIAIGILSLIVIGLVMTQLHLTTGTKFQLFQLHKSIGITVLGLALLRVAWRLSHRPPPLPSSMPAAERQAAESTHTTLYVFMLGLPLSGWAMVSASPRNIPTVLYGLVHWPHLPVLSTLHDKATVEKVLVYVHVVGAWMLIAVLVLHIGAALRHQFILRDQIMSRMLPLLSRERRPS